LAYLPVIAEFGLLSGRHRQSDAGQGTEEVVDIDLHLIIFNTVRVRCGGTVYTLVYTCQRFGWNTLVFGIRLAGHS
jgi:hypothetical protein